jgi:hypothetical protein
LEDYIKYEKIDWIKKRSETIKTNYYSEGLIF